MKESQRLLEIERLRIVFESQSQTVPVVEDVSLHVRPRQIVALIGESGSGKSVTAQAIVGLLDRGGRIDGGSLRLAGHDLAGCSAKQLRQLRGSEAAMIFQDPLHALNPLLTIGHQLVETIRRHQRRTSRRERRAHAMELMARVGLEASQRVYESYPFELSGGMCQRVMIALALASRARLLIADEPTTALDTLVQAQILRELSRLRREDGLAILLITHDMGVVAELADYVYVMKAGRIVESGEAHRIFRAATHPYTRELLSSR